jgi:hypothetical protein
MLFFAIIAASSEPILYGVIVGFGHGEGHV